MKRGDSPDGPHGTLRFELELPPRFAGRSVPIEVRRRDRRLAGRYSPDEVAILLPGSYYVSARLPASIELTDWVEIEANTETVARLAPETGASGSTTDQPDGDRHLELSPGDENVPSQQEGGAFESPSRQRIANVAEAATGITTALRIWVGDPSSKPHWHPIDSAALVMQRRRDGGVSVSIPARRQQVLVQVITINRPARVLVVPHVPLGSPVEVILSCVSASDGISADAHLENADADLLIRYGNDRSRATSIAQSMEARGLLQAKAADPIAAAAGAVALLAVDDGDRATAWLVHLAESFEWLVDGAALAAEALARQGDHDRAFAMLERLGAGRLPLFGASLGYAIDRLASYARLKDGPDREEGRRAKALLARLEPYGRFRVPSRPLTTFWATDPNCPGDDPIIAIPTGAVALPA